MGSREKTCMEPLFTRNFVLCTLVSFCFTTVFFMLYTAMAGYSSDVLGVGSTVSGLVASIFIAGDLIARLAVGNRIRSFGPRRMSLICMSVGTGITLLYFVSDSVAAMCIVRFVHGMTYGAAASAINTMVAESLPVTRRGEGLGYFMLSYSFASAIGSLICMYLQNSGRCRELLVPGAEVFLSVSDNPARSTKYDLVAVRKGNRLINMDSQIPNDVAKEGLRGIPLFSKVERITREYRYGNSRIDLMAEGEGKRYLIEVKGVTLENDGVVSFPDAPTERGAKHIRELMGSRKDGFIPCLLFFIQMSEVKYFEPAKSIDPEFANALHEAKAAGVNILAYDCLVTPDSLELGNPVEIRI